MRDHGQDRSRWSRVGPKKGNEPRRIITHRSRSGSTGLSTTGAGSAMARETTMHTTTVSARCMRRRRRPTSPPTPRRSPRNSGFSDWKSKGGDEGKGQGEGQGKGKGRGYGGGPGQDRRMRSIEEVAEDMLRTLEELKAQQRGGQSPGGSQPEGAAGSQSRGAPTGVGPRTSLLRKSVDSQRKRRHIRCRRRLQKSQNH